MSSVGMTCRALVSVFILLISSSALAVEYASPVFAAGDGYKNLVLHDTAKSGSLILYTASGQVVDGIPEEQFSNFTDLYIYDVENGSHSLLSVGLNNTVSNGNVEFAQFAGEDTVYFTSRATNLVDGATLQSGTNFYKYDLTSNSISHINRPVGSLYDMQQLLISEKGGVAYATYNNKIYRLNTTSDAWEATNVNSSWGRTALEGVSNDGQLAYETQDYSLAIMSDDNTTRIVQRSFLKAGITDDGKKLFVLNDKSIREYDLASNDLAFVDHVPANTLIKKFDTGAISISSDGRYVAVKVELVEYFDRSVQSSSRRGLFVFDLESDKSAKVNVFDGQEYSRDQSQFMFDGSGSTIYFVQSPSYTRGFVASSSLTDSLFEYDAPSNNTNVSSESPLTVDITNNTVSDFLAVTRKITWDSEKTSFISNSSVATDFKFGLSKDAYEYSIALCNANFVCDFDATSTSQVEVKGFSSVPVLSAERGKSAGPQANAFISYISTNAEGAEYVKFDDPSATALFKRAGESDSVVYAKTVSSGADHLVVASFCVRNYNGTYSCGDYGKPLVQEVPNFFSRNEVRIKPLPDYSAMSVSWPNVDGLTFEVYRRIGNEDFQKVYSGEDNQFLDRDLYYSQSAEYAVLQCQSELCQSVRASSSTFDRVREAISVSSIDYYGHYIRLNMSFYYAYDFVKISKRESEKGLPFVELDRIEASSFRSNYSVSYDDYAVKPSVKYEYLIEGCTDSKCIDSV